MGTTLTGKNISASYLGLLKSTDNLAISSSAKTITDGAGNDLPIKLSTAQFLVSDGSSSTPTIGFSSDTDTGLYRTGSGVLGITSNGTLSGEITLTGYRAKKNTTASAPNYTFIGDDNTGLHSLDADRLDFILGGNRAFGMTYATGLGTLQTLSTDSMAFHVGSERIRIINNGGIGIGTSTVTSGYDIDVLSSGGDARILLRPSSNDEASYQLGNSSGDILTHFATSNGSSIINHAVGTGTLQLKTNASKAIEIDSSQNIQFNAYGGGTITGTATQRLGVDSSGNVIEIPIGAGAVDGSGTAGKIVKWSDSDTITDSIISESSSKIGIGTANPLNKIHILTGDDVTALFQSNDAISRIEFADNNTTGSTRPSIGASGNNTIFTQGTTERLRLDSSGRLGLGTTSPNHLLDVESTGASMRVYNTTSNGDTEFYITTAGTTGASKILFGDTADADIGKIIYRHNGNSMAFETNDSEAMRIDSSGNTTFAGNVTLSNASSPKISITDTSQTTTLQLYAQDSNTHVGNATAHDLVFDTNNTERMRIRNSTGSVGIGTNPSTLLHLSNATDPTVRVEDSSSGMIVGLQANDSAGFVGTTSNSDFSIRTNNSTRVHIENSGLVGIGTTSPAKNLVINSSSGAQLQLQLNSNDRFRMEADSFGGSFYSPSGYGARFFTSGSERIRITSAGNIGIATTSPTTLLDLGAGNTQGDGIGFGSNITEIRRGNSGTNLQMSHWGNISMIIDSDNNDSSRFFNVMHGNNDSSSATEVFRVQEDGKTGIGTTSPSVQLDIEDTSNVLIDLNTTTANNNTTIRFQESGSNKATIGYDGTNDGLILTTGGFTAGNGIFIDDSQNVGIGTSSPTSGKLHVVDGNIRISGSAEYALKLRHDSASADSNLLQTSNGSFIYKFGSSERLRLDSSGRLGIGLTPTTSPLEIKSNSVSSQGSGLSIIANGSTDAIIKMGERDTNGGRFHMFDSGVEKIAFYTDGTDNHISAGNVGIGTNSPSEKLTISATNSGGANNNTLRFVDTDVTTQANQSFGKIEFETKDTNNAGVNAFINAFAEGTGGTGALSFGTGSGGSSERMRIDSSGNFLVGTTNTDPTFNRVDGVVISTNDAVLCRSGASWDIGRNSTSGTHITFYTDNGSARVTAGNIASSGSTTSFNTSSDYRLKEDLQDFNALEIASKIKMYDFKWKADDSRSYGVMAHELEEVLPQAVSGKKDAEEMQSVDYSKLVPILLKSIQELKAEVDELKKNK